MTFLDKGYVTKWLVDRMCEQQIAFITKVRKNMPSVERISVEQAVMRRRPLTLKPCLTRSKTVFRSNIHAIARMITFSSI